MLQAPADDEAKGCGHRTPSQVQAAMTPKYPQAPRQSQRPAPSEMQGGVRLWLDLQDAAGDGAPERAAAVLERSGVVACGQAARASQWLFQIVTARAALLVAPCCSKVFIDFVAPDGSSEEIECSLMKNNTLDFGPLSSLSLMVLASA